MQKNGFKLIIGFFFCLFAGLSLTTAVIPMVMSNVFDMYSMDLLLAVRGYSIPLALLWGAGGVFIAWQSSTTAKGAVTLGACGLVSGLVLGMFALAGSLAVIATAIGAGLIYGAIGGAILGKAFSTIMNNSEA